MYEIENLERDSKTFAYGKPRRKDGKVVDPGEVVLGSTRDLGVVGMHQPRQSVSPSVYERLLKIKYFAHCIDTGSVRATKLG